MNHTIEIVGPFEQRELVVDGWTVPFLNVRKVDGGRIHFTLDHRLGFDVSAADFDQVARLLADAVSIALGLTCHPGHLTDEQAHAQLAACSTHRALLPMKLTGITGVSTSADGEE